MRRRHAGLAGACAWLMAVGLVHAGAADGGLSRRLLPPAGMVYSRNAFKVPYLGLDGTFTLDQQELSATDPRNPPRIVFRQMEYFPFMRTWQA
jgi:hypothetical protein